MALPEIQRGVMRVPDSAGNYTSFEFDCVERETHELRNTLTDHPVETGSPPTDHSRPEPRKVTLEIVQTNTPNTGADGADRARQLWQLFVDLWERPKILALDTGRDFYPSMGIEGVTSTFEAKSAQTMTGSVVFKEIRVVQNKFTRVVPTTDTRGQRKKDLGKETSVAARLWDGASAMFSGAP